MTGRNGQSKGLGKDDPGPKNSSKNSRVQKPESSEGQKGNPDFRSRAEAMGGGRSRKKKVISKHEHKFSK